MVTITHSNERGRKAGKWLLLGALAAVIALLASMPLVIRALRLRLHARYLLSAEDISHAIARASSLSAMGDAAGPALLGALSRGEAHVRYAAATYLVRSGRGVGDEVVAALRESGRHDPDAAVRAAAGFSLCRAGRVGEGLPFMTAALSLGPGDSGYALKRVLAVRFRVREAVESLSADFKTLKGKDAARALGFLCDVVARDIEGLPKLKEWAKERNVTDLAEYKGELAAEIHGWWEEEQANYRSIKDVGRPSSNSPGSDGVLGGD